MMHLEMAAHLGSPHGPADLDAIPFPAWQCPIPPLPTFTGLNDIALPLDVHYMKDLVSQKKKRPSRAGGVDDLQELCTQKGLPTKGLKADLVRWLAAYDAAPTDSGRASAQQSAARDASKIREEKTKRSKLHFVQPEGRCKCNVQLRQCKRCWGIGICDHNEVKSECWECAEQSPGEDLPLAKRTLGQLRVAYDRQGLNEKYCPQAAKTSRRQTLPYKSDLLNVLERLASLDETELAARLFDLKALDEKAQAVPKSRAPERFEHVQKMRFGQKTCSRRKTAARRTFRRKHRQVDGPGARNVPAGPGQPWRRSKVRLEEHPADGAGSHFDPDPHTCSEAF
jgi:hypothetical protein